MSKNLPPKKFLIGKHLPGFEGHEISRLIGSGANGRVFYGHDPSTNSSLAFKVILAGALPKGEELPLGEAKKANQIDHQSVLRCTTVFPYQDSGINTLIFVYDYVDGKNLRDYMQENSDDIGVSFIENFLRTMFELLYELEGRNFSHGDLHAGNILVAKSKFDIHGRTTFRVTDFGVQQFSEHPNNRSDYLLIAETLSLLLECINYQDCDGRDRFVFDILRDYFLKRYLIETDASADDFFRSPRKMLTKLDELDDKYRLLGENPEGRKLITPFDYPNCEQIGNSNLLLKNLYSDRLLGLSEIHARSNLILTGPRGCGKTTVFRALSIDYLTSVGGVRPENIRYIGIYYRCDDLYFAFPRYRHPDRPEALNIPMHFFIVTLLAKVLEQLAMLGRNHFSKEFEKKEKSLALNLWNVLGLTKPMSPNADKLESLIDKLNKERQRAAKKQKFANAPKTSIGNYFDPGAMVEACQCIRNNFSFLRDYPFYFFIDDYSHPKITMALQENLNRLLMHRSPDIFFKLSTESPVSFSPEDIDGKKFTEGREYNLVNLGLRYITGGMDQVLEFLKDLFRRRFKEVEEYPVQTLEELLGSIPRNENKTALAFREKSKKSKFGYYAGCETLAAMCSGDIHYMIRLVSKMVDENGGEENLKASQTSPKISHQQQHITIRKSAGEFMESIRTLPGMGPNLVRIVTAFGKVAHSYLRFQNSSNESNNPPHQASRIEPYEPLSLSDEAENNLKELLRYSVLIQDPRGKSRRGDVVPRFYLRRYLMPHFRLTFSQRDSLSLENSQLEELLCKPKKFENKMELKSEKDANRCQHNPNQESLFKDE